MHQRCNDLLVQHARMRRACSHPPQKVQRLQALLSPQSVHVACTYTQTRISVSDCRYTQVPIHTDTHQSVCIGNLECCALIDHVIADDIHDSNRAGARTDKSACLLTRTTAVRPHHQQPLPSRLSTLAPHPHPPRPLGPLFLGQSNASIKIIQVSMAPSPAALATVNTAFLSTGWGVGGRGEHAQERGGERG